MFKSEELHIFQSKKEKQLSQLTKTLKNAGAFWYGVGCKESLFLGKRNYIHRHMSQNVVNISAVFIRKNIISLILYFPDYFAS